MSEKTRIIQLANDALKRTLDVWGALFLLVFLSPVLLVVACVVRLTSPGPVIFKQRRLTQGGRTFMLLKFRTMCQEAEAGRGATWAAENDARVTPFGRILRKYRIDELPQLVNVITGEMSLIGPRPERPEIARELERQMPEFRKRLLVPAGLTGLAQVELGYAADEEAMRKKLHWDMRYVSEKSFLLDAQIALKTVQVVMTGFGAR